MSRILVTGSADGLGLLAARLLIAEGHAVVVHGRDEPRAADALAGAPGAVGALSGDLASLAQTRALAERANEDGPFDAVLHNAAVGYRERRSETEDGLEHVFQINVLAPYLLTALMLPPRRLVYMGSGMHRSGDVHLDDLQWTRRSWNGAQAYADSKLLDVVLAFAVARRWPDVRANAVDPGWVATKMGGAGAPDDLEEGARTQAWLAAGTDPATAVTGRYLFHREEAVSHAATTDPVTQDGLLAVCAELTGVALPPPSP